MSAASFMELSQSLLEEKREKRDNLGSSFDLQAVIWTQDLSSTHWTAMCVNIFFLRFSYRASQYIYLSN